MITVWGRRNSLNVQKVMWALGELELDYERLDVAGSFGFPDGYEEINPNRVVPTIRDGELTMYESNACVRYLSRRYGEGALWPRDAIAAALADQWMDWTASTLGPAFFQVFMNKIRLPANRADTAQIEAGTRTLANLCRGLDEHFDDRDYIAGDFSMGDIPIGCVFYRYFNLDIERPAAPNVQAWYERLAERQAYRKHVMIPFGTNAEEWSVEERKNAGIQ